LSFDKPEILSLCLAICHGTTGALRDEHAIRLLAQACTYMSCPVFQELEFLLFGWFALAETLVALC
jgi:hypothetical protein